MGIRQDYGKFQAVTLFEQVSLAQKRGLQGWEHRDVLARLRAVHSDAKERRALVAELKRQCAEALQRDDETLQAPREPKRARPNGGSLAEASGDDEDSDNAPKRGPADADYRPMAAAQRTAGGGTDPMEEPSSSEDEAPPPPSKAPTPPPIPQGNMSLMPEEIAECLQEMANLNLPEPKEPEAVKSQHARNILRQLEVYRLEPGQADAAYEEVRGMLRPGVEAMEHQKRTAKFLEDAVGYFGVAGNALDCGLGKTMSTILYVLRMRHRYGDRLAIVCGKVMLFGTWEQEIARCLPEGSYVMVNIGPGSFARSNDTDTWQTGALDTARAGLRGGKLVFLYLQLHVLNKPYGVMSLIAGAVDMADGGASLIVEESHEQCRNLNVPSEALAALARRCRGTVLVSGTPVMSDACEARHLILMCNGRLHRAIEPPDALKVFGALCFRAGSDTPLPPLHVWMLRVPAVPAHKLQGLTAQVRARAVVYGNGVEASEHPKFQAAAAAAIALADSGRGTLICAENRAGVQQLREMLRAGLEARQGKCFLLSGDTPDSEREGALAEMRTLCASGRPVVVIATPQVAAAGLNMQDLSAVLLVGLFWTMQDLRQTVARAHRIGQKRGCLCVALVTGREDQAQLDIMQRKTRSTAAYYGDQSAHMLRDDHIERLGVCEVGGVAGAVGQMLARLDEGKPGPEHAQGAAPWPLFCRSSETFE